MNGITGVNSASGAMAGTPIQDLNLVNMQGVQYDTMHNFQHEQGHNAQHHMHQAQHMPYQMASNCDGYPSFNRPPQQQIMQQHTSLSPRPMAPSAPSMLSSSSQDLDELLAEEPTVGREGMDGDNSVLSFIPKMMREPLVLFLIYMILAQEVVQTTIGKITDEVIPNETTCVVSMIGRAIYGIILVVFYMLAKQFIL